MSSPSIPFPSDDTREIANASDVSVKVASDSAGVKNKSKFDRVSNESQKKYPE